MGLADIERPWCVSPVMILSRLRSPYVPRILRLAGIALAAGAVAGMAAAGDIEASYRKGRVAPVTFAAATPPSAQLPVEPIGDRALAHAHGYALAAQHRFDSTAACRTVRAEFRAGCEDYVDQSRASPTDGLGFAG